MSRSPEPTDLLLHRIQKAYRPRSPILKSLLPLSVFKAAVFHLSSPLVEIVMSSEGIEDHWLMGLEIAWVPYEGTGESSSVQRVVGRDGVRSHFVLELTDRLISFPVDPLGVTLKISSERGGSVTFPYPKRDSFSERISQRK